MTAFPQRLPAAPLVTVIDRLVARGRNEADVCRTLQLSINVLWEWRRQPGRRIDPSTPDRVVTASPYLWFDVWPVCERGDRHSQEITGSGECSVCWAHQIAEYVFTGVRGRRGRC